MARNTRNAALYELINKTRFKNAQQKALARIGVKPGQPPELSAESVKQEEKPVITSAEEIKSAEVKTAEFKPEAVWSARPKPIRFYPDRIELCFSWQVAGITLLAFFALLLVFFRLGQIASIKKTPEAKVSKSVTSVQAVMPESRPIMEKSAITEKLPKMVEQMGNNVIVIKSYDLRPHLEPVKKYFAEYGIATEIIKNGSHYLLVTQNRYDNIDKAGTDGYEMKRKIMSVGAGYKPPAGSGFESFGTKPFQDVYGMKISLN